MKISANIEYCGGMKRQFAFPAALDLDVAVLSKTPKLL